MEFGKHALCLCTVYERREGCGFKNALQRPATFLNALRYAGFDALVMANKNSCDTGAYGILNALDNVENYSFMRTGLFSNADEQRFILADVNGIKIALMSYATYCNTKDTYLTEEGAAIMLNRYSEKRVQEDV